MNILCININTFNFFKVGTSPKKNEVIVHVFITTTLPLLIRNSLPR